MLFLCTDLLKTRVQNQRYSMPLLQHIQKHKRPAANCLPIPFRTNTRSEIMVILDKI